MLDQQSIEDIESKIKDIVERQEEFTAEHWLESHEDLIRDSFIESVTLETDSTMQHLARELNSTYRSLYLNMSGDDIVKALKSKMTELEIVEELVDMCEIRESEPMNFLTVGSWSHRQWDEEIFVEDSLELNELVSLLPDGNPLKKDMFMMRIDIKPVYFSVQADLFLNRVAPTLDAFLLDQQLNDVLKSAL